MSRKAVAVDYNKCRPAECDGGGCVAALECEHGSLVQESAYETPEVNPAKWCRTCAKCARLCPLGAIRML